MAGSTALARSILDGARATHAPPAVPHGLRCFVGHLCGHSDRRAAPQLERQLKVLRPQGGRAGGGGARICTVHAGLRVPARPHAGRLCGPRAAGKSQTGGPSLGGRLARDVGPVRAQACGQPPQAQPGGAGVAHVPAAARRPRVPPLPRGARDWGAVWGRRESPVICKESYRGTYLYRLFGRGVARVVSSFVHVLRADAIQPPGVLPHVPPPPPQPIVPKPPPWLPTLLVGHPCLAAHATGSPCGGAPMRG